VTAESYPTPEEAVLAEWRELPHAKVRVLSVEYSNENEAVVVTDTEPSHPMRNYCFRSPDGWVFSYDHN
jgi:hypothetical protein